MGAVCRRALGCEWGAQLQSLRTGRERSLLCMTLAIPSLLCKICTLANRGCTWLKSQHKSFAQVAVGGRGRRRRGGPCRARRQTLAGGPCLCPTLKKSAWTVQQAGHVVADPPNSVCGQVFRYFSGLERETGPTVHAEPSGWISRQLLYHAS